MIICVHRCGSFNENLQRSSGILSSTSGACAKWDRGAMQVSVGLESCELSMLPSQAYRPPYPHLTSVPSSPSALQEEGRKMLDLCSLRNLGRLRLLKSLRP